MARSSSSFGPLISADELAELLVSSDDVRVIDVRWSLADPHGGHARYVEGHIPGAVPIDLEDDITGREGPGRHPLPTREQFEAAMRRAGVRKSDRVVVYDDGGASVSARVRWLLQLFGHDEVAVLDGGLQAWQGELESGFIPPPLGDFVAVEPAERPYLLRGEVEQLAADTVLIDVRAPERYAGEIEPVDPVAGHIPGAVNAFWQTNLDEGGRYLAPDELRRKYEALGVKGEAVVYCGSGLNACQGLLALEIAGIDAKVYAGSWSDWVDRDDPPVETGWSEATPSDGWSEATPSDGR